MTLFYSGRFGQIALHCMSISQNPDVKNSRCSCIIEPKYTVEEQMISLIDVISYQKLIHYNTIYNIQTTKAQNLHYSGLRKSSSWAPLRDESTVSCKWGRTSFESPLQSSLHGEGCYALVQFGTPPAGWLPGASITTESTSTSNDSYKRKGSLSLISWLASNSKASIFH